MPWRATPPSTRRRRPDTVRSWAGQTAAGLPVRPQAAAGGHPRAAAGRRDGEPLRAFLAAVEPLGSRAHTLWVQLPPSFGPDGLGALAGFLAPPPGELPARGRGAAPRVLRRPAVAAASWSGSWRERTRSGSPSIPRCCSTGRRPAPAEREAWTKKPRLPRLPRALTGHPVVRYIGRDDDARTVAGWQPWLETVAGWLREGRSPTVFIHTPDNVAALGLARRFHDEMRARVPEVRPLPEPVPAGPPTLF